MHAPIGLHVDKERLHGGDLVELFIGFTIDSLTMVR